MQVHDGGGGRRAGGACRTHLACPLDLLLLSAPCNLGRPCSGCSRRLPAEPRAAGRQPCACGRAGAPRGCPAQRAGPWLSRLARRAPAKPARPRAAGSRRAAAAAACHSWRSLRCVHPCHGVAHSQVAALCIEAPPAARLFTPPPAGLPPHHAAPAGGMRPTSTHPPPISNLALQPSPPQDLFAPSRRFSCTRVLRLRAPTHPLAYPNSNPRRTFSAPSCACWWRRGWGWLRSTRGRGWPSTGTTGGRVRRGAGVCRGERGGGLVVAIVAAVGGVRLGQPPLHAPATPSPRPRRAPARRSAAHAGARRAAAAAAAARAGACRSAGAGHGAAGAAGEPLPLARLRLDPRKGSRMRQAAGHEVGRCWLPSCTPHERPAWDAGSGRAGPARPAHSPLFPPPPPCRPRRSPAASITSSPARPAAASRGCCARRAATWGAAWGARRAGRRLQGWASGRGACDPSHLPLPLQRWPASTGLALPCQRAELGCPAPDCLEHLPAVPRPRPAPLPCPAPQLQLRGRGPQIGCSAPPALHSRACVPPRPRPRPPSYVDVGPAFEVDWGRDLGNAFNFRCAARRRGGGAGVVRPAAGQRLQLQVGACWGCLMA